MRVGSDRIFHLVLGCFVGTYVLLIVSMLVADASFTSGGDLWAAIQSPEIRAATILSLVSASLTALLSVWFAVPIGYVMAHSRFRGRALLDAILDIPIVLPPMVIGLSLLILFASPIGQAIESVIPVTYHRPSIVIAQFAVACAFAVRTMIVTFQQINPRHERVAQTLGCRRSQAFWHVVLPQARRGMVSAFLLAWARALGEFGPILVFSGATRMKTEVLPTTVFLELSIGQIEAAVAVSLLMVAAAVLVLLLGRAFGMAGLPR